MVTSQLVTDTPYEGETRPVITENWDEKSSRSFGMMSGHSLAKTILRESQSCTKRLLLGRATMPSHPPPVNFSQVFDGLYRSGYPQPEDYPFLQSLNLKTIVTLVNKELPEGYREFMETNHITHRVFDMAGTKKEEIPVELMRSIIQVVSDRRNYPMLIHCNHGKHRTGCVIGVLRKSKNWDMKRIIDEYTSFAEPKVRETDLKYLADFELKSLLLQPRVIALRAPASRFYRFILAALVVLLFVYLMGKMKVQDQI
jgi:tyrosine-protein phosphatase SIW14